MRGWSPFPREPAKWTGDLSMMRRLMPRRARSQARVRPVGPAPTISTGVCARSRLVFSNGYTYIILVVGQVLLDAKVSSGRYLMQYEPPLHRMEDEGW